MELQLCVLGPGRVEKKDFIEREEEAYTSEDPTNCTRCVIFRRIQLNTASFLLGFATGFLIFSDSFIAQLARFVLDRINSAPCGEDGPFQRMFSDRSLGLRPRKWGGAPKHLTERILSRENDRHVVTALCQLISWEGTSESRVWYFK